MLVSWDWLKQYVPLDMPCDELTDRLAMSGLNHESTTELEFDTVIDLEVTSNRGDCLGHIGIAREVSVLWNLPLRLPNVELVENGPAVAKSIRITNEYPEGCSRYIGRVIRGVKIGPSPAWLASRLETIGIASINNVVDITNYVMFECGQPLHAFDLSRIAGAEIIVRRARAEETFDAIDHRTYTLDENMVMIADAARAVAIGGVMGGLNSEVSDDTCDLLIEAADFAPMSVRRTARKLRLHSPSSYRYERRVDPAGLQWASRRCCQLILELAGGVLDSGCVDTGAEPKPRETVSLRHQQVTRVLGIEVPGDETARIVSALGCQVNESSPEKVVCVPPSYRHDLTREIDLIEEVARVYGYHKIPEDAVVPMAASAKRPKDYVAEHVRQVMTAAGIDEALTPSLVTGDAVEIFSPWNRRPSLITETPLLEGANHLRRSLIPSLLEARRFNQNLGSRSADMFETATIYLPSSKPNSLPDEQWTLGIVCGQDFWEVKGIIETLLAQIQPNIHLTVSDQSQPLLDNELSVRLLTDGEIIGYMGKLSPEGMKACGLDHAAIVAELNLGLLTTLSRAVPTAAPVSPYPAIGRDLNLVVDEAVRWGSLEEAVKKGAGSELQSVQYRETYRNPEKDGPNKKRVLLSLSLQSQSRTLTGHEADRMVEQIVAACRESLGASLLA